jgi:hypothetical protein
MEVSMDENGQENPSLEEKMKIIQEAADELDNFIDEEYRKIKIILERNSAPADVDFTLTVGIQNAYLG